MKTNIIKSLAALLALTFMVIYSSVPFSGSSALIAQASGNLVTIMDEDVPLAHAAKVLKPEASGKQTQSGGGATVDYSNCNEGYVMVKCSGGKKTKVQITKKGSKTYTYDLKSSGSYEVFPLTNGNGTYTVGIFQNVSGNQYAQALSTSISVKLRNSMLPFLYPNQYINFNSKSKTVEKGAELADKDADQLKTVENVYNYVIKNLTYDTAKAKNVKSGYLPAVDSILASKKGICFDYAAVMAAMLRSQSIPTRLEVGYVSGGAYHAWISVYIKGVGWVNNAIYFDGKKWSLMDPTFASGAGAKYVGNGKDYSTQYLY